MPHKRPRVSLLLLAVLAIALLLVAGAKASPDTAPDTIVNPGSQAFRNEIQYESQFGADPLVMLITGDVASIFGGAGLTQLDNAELNLITNTNKARGIQTVYGPATIATVTANAALGSVLGRMQAAEAAAQAKAIADARAAGKSDADAQKAGQDAAAAAGQQVIADAIKQYPELAKIGVPSPTNAAWVSAIFLNNGQPKAKWAPIVPDGRHIVVTARPRPETTNAGVDAIVASERQVLKSSAIPGASAVISGAPVLQSAVARALRLALFSGMLLGLVSMAILLLAALRGRFGLAIRLVPLAAGAITVCVLSGVVTLVGLGAANLRALAGIDQPVLQDVLASATFALNPATLAAFPIALGLAVDYAVQFTFRYQQSLGDGPESAWATARLGAGRATLRAAACTVAGLMALLISSIPMVRQFGLVMALGAVIAWVVARLCVLACLRAWPGLALARAARSTASGLPRTAAEPTPVSSPAMPAGAAVAVPIEDDFALFGMSPSVTPAAAAAASPMEVPAVDDAAAEPANEAAEAPSVFDWLVNFSRRRRMAILAPAFVVAAVGWAAVPFATFETDPEKLVSPHLPAFADVNTIRQATGSSGELDFILKGPDVTSPAALKWVRDLQGVVQNDTQGSFKPIGSLAGLFSDISAGQDLPTARINALLAITPSYIADSLVSADHHLARVAFGINLAPVADQARQIHQVLSDIEPPPGYTYYPAGVSYLGVQGLESLQSGQVPLNALAAFLVLAVLVLIYRRRRLALLAWAPTLLVAGWSSAVLTVFRVPLTPMTAVLGALVVAFGTEFAVLWLERYREALKDGVAPGDDAAAAATHAAGPGILTSGAALILGFLALVVGGLPGVANLGFDLPMVRDFGLVAAMDMLLAVGAALVVLPALVTRVGLTETAPSPARRRVRPLPIRGAGGR